MKKGIVFILALTMLLCGCQNDKSQPELIIESLGIPFLEQYPDDFVSRCPWDIAIWDGKLYVGAGDYGNNTGPVDCMAYDIKNCSWENTGTLPQESIARFCTVDDQLMIPGIDSTMAGDLLGDYYYLHEGIWNRNRVLPGGIHCFDLVSFEGKLFAGLGVIQDQYPVAVSSDNGKSFNQVPFYRDGQLLATIKDVIRVYDLVVMNQTLYAIYISENNEQGKNHDFECCFYRYTEDGFVYETTWEPCYQSVGAVQMAFGAKEVFCDQLFVATGHLYRMNHHLERFEQVLSGEMITLDLLQQGDHLYTLNNTPLTDGTFDVSVWRTKTGESFEEVFHFNHSTPALSFALYDETFYIGIGNINLKHDTNGTILSVKMK